MRLEEIMGAPPDGRARREILTMLRRTKPNPGIVHLRAALQAAKSVPAAIPAPAARARGLESRVPSAPFRQAGVPLPESLARLRLTLTRLPERVAPSDCRPACGTSPLSSTPGDENAPAMRRSVRGDETTRYRV